jgi:transportin-3
MTTWKDVLATIGSTLGNVAGDCVLEFLRILPEEVTEGRKINLSVCSAISDLLLNTHRSAVH